MKADKITEQHDAGLISTSEACDSLRNLDAQARFNADYSDHYDSYWRWTREGQAARLALAAI